MKKFAILTLGCKVNSYESEAIINLLTSKGYEMVSFNEQADVYIVNTCTVTKTSDQKSRQMLSRARRLNPSSIVVAMGCFSQLNYNEASINANIVLGSNNKLQVYELIESYVNTKRSINAITDVLNKPVYEEMCLNNLVTHTRGFIKIQDGCENYCSYCAIPYSRGKIRSRNPENIINEVRSLVSSGTKEIILAGINTGTYGQDLSNINLSSLISRLLLETNIHRIRLSSIELMEITDDLLHTLKNNKERVCMHLHIPLQGGSNGVLSRMHRKYNITEYYDKITHIRNILGDIALTTDILAGFVGETVEEFNETKEFIKKIGFYEMHVFPYSRRLNTLADEIPGHLDEKVKKERCNELICIASIMKKDYILRHMNNIEEVIVETKKNGYYHGHTSNYLDVYFKYNSEVDLTNKLVDVKITSYSNDTIYGVLERIKDE